MRFKKRQFLLFLCLLAFLFLLLFFGYSLFTVLPGEILSGNHPKNIYYSTANWQQFAGAENANKTELALLQAKMALERRETVKKMMAHAWGNYVEYAWGKNELGPVSKSPKFGPFGAHLGATIVDAADTLWIMGMKKEFEKAAQWIGDNLNSKNIYTGLSFFEANIRLVGGLLSAYALSGNKIFLTKGREMADALLPAFNTPTGIPRGWIVPANGVKAIEGCSTLTGLGTNQLEFAYLSKVTGDPKYAKIANRARDFVLNNTTRPNGLYFNFIDPIDGKWCRHWYNLMGFNFLFNLNQAEVSIGARGDSFYEYLLKVWLFNGANKTDPLWRHYANAMEAMEKYLLKKTFSNFWYFAEMAASSPIHRMEHLACFSGGMFAIQSIHEKSAERASHYLELAEQIARTCHESYAQTATGIGPEVFGFSLLTGRMYPVDSSFILRPEAVESWFYLWRITRKPIYREWAWEATMAIETNCRMENGYSGILDVNAGEGKIKFDNEQQSFFLAETLKYLYLIFSDEDEAQYPLDKWVFNTEAHPFPIK